MNQPAFEKRVLEIWMRSRVPLTAAHLQHLTGAPRDKMGKWLDAMAVAGVLDVDSDDDGEITWKVRGAGRAAGGALTVAELERFERVSAEVQGNSAPTRALVGASRALGLTRGGGGESKSVVASGVLSLFFGPLGWLYAAPLREAVPAAVGFALAAAIVPHFILAPLLGLAAPLSALAGVYYAWRHNQVGGRTGLFSDEKSR